MKIALMSKEFINNDIHFNLNQIKKSIDFLHSKIDLICFGEAFLQGFDSLSWNYNIDKNIAVTLDSAIINEIKEYAKKMQTAVSFGFMEKIDDKIYCSYIVIGDDGSIVDIYRRVSIGWKEYKITDNHYYEGSDFHSFKYKGLTFVVALCGDLWCEENIHKINRLNKDIILWPLYISFNIEDNPKQKLEYINKSKTFKCPLLFINSICRIDNSRGGCYVFNNGSVEQELKMGEDGLLIYEASPHK